MLVDLNGDGKLDLAFSNEGKESASWKQNDGVGGFPTGKALGSYVGSKDILFADIDLDGDLDRLGTRQQDEWFENDGVGGFTAHPGFGLGLEWAGDVDADGLVDLVFVGPTEVTWRRNSGSLTFAAAAGLFDSVDGSGNDVRLVAADFNGDFRTDFIANLAGGQVGVYLRATDGSTYAKSLLPGLPSLYRPAVGDIDGDGDRDIVASGSKFVNNGSGVFAASPLEGLPGLRLADLDSDGRMDLADFSGWYRQEPDGTFQFQTYLAGFAGTFYVATGDIDGDGDIDVVTNTGPYGEVWSLENPLLTSSQATIADWRQQHFGSPENDGEGADDRDPDWDGVINLLEYTFGLDPHDATGINGAGGVPVLRRDPGLPPVFQFGLPVPTARDLTISIEFKGSSLLLGTSDTWTTVATRSGHGAWTSSPAVPSFVGILSGGAIVDGRQNMSLRAAVVEGHALWRIRVEREP